MTVYDFRDGEAKLIDEQVDIHELYHTGNPDPACWICMEKAANLCSCGHDKADEHRPLEIDGDNYRYCDECRETCERVGEREDFEAKTAEINAKAMPKVLAAVKAWVKK